MKKIILLNHGLASGGTDTFCVNVLKKLNELDYKVGIIMAVDPGALPQFREKEVRDMGISVYRTSDLGADCPKTVSHMKPC
jgi:hypothetical protein